jgi:CheY-like chemotaxis protein
MLGKQKFILLADDDQEDLELLEEAINTTEPDAKLHSVLNGRLAFDFLENCKDADLPCLIILDYNMPEMNGANVLEKICSQPRYKEIPKLIWSTSSNSAYVKECMEKGATAYFVKPASHKQLQDLAKEMLAFC